MKKGMTRRRLLALVLCLAMLFSCVPQGAIPVFAAGDEASQGQPETGETPTEPEVTTEPTEPEDTTAPTEPEVTTEPTQPEDTTAPTEPEVTTEPTEPEDTTTPTEPEVTTDPTQPQKPQEPQNPAVPLAGEVVASGDLTSTITYTITKEVDPDGPPYHVLTLEGTGPMVDYGHNDSAPWDKYNSTLRQIHLGDGITTVGDRSFGGSSITTLDLTACSTLTSIGEYAFSGCDSLTSVNLTGLQKLESIGEYAFSNMDSLTSVSLADATNLTYIGQNAFAYCYELSSLDLSGLTSLFEIDSEAFSYCKRLTYLDLSDLTRLSEISFQAFNGCSGLTSLDFSNLTNLTSIGYGAFQGCTGLTGVLDLSGLAKLREINKYAFSGTDFASLDLSGCTSLGTIYDNAFSGCPFTTINFTGCTALKTIKPYAFAGCSSLTDLVFESGNSLTTVSGDAFNKTTNVRRMRLFVPDAKSAEGVLKLLNISPEGPIWVSFGGDNVYLTGEILEALADSRCSVAFAPGRHTFTLEDTAQTAKKAAPLNALEGPAWVDQQGVVYLLNEADNTATLAYIPSNVKDYTVPETVGDGEKTYPIASVSSHALARAYHLEKITFVSSKEVTLNGFALAGCPTLVSVNGETTVAGAKSLFNKCGESAFLGTGLLDEGYENEVPIDTPIDASPDTNVTFTLTAGTSKEPWKEGTTGTGNSATIDAYIGGSAVADYCYRIYFLVSHEKFDIGGFQMEVDHTYTDEGIEFTLRSHPQLPGLYYVDVLVPSGMTWKWTFALNYPKLTPGGQVLVWAESGLRSMTSEPQTRPTGGYYHFTWETESVPYTMSVINSGGTYGYTRTGVDQPITLSPDLSWNLMLTAGSREDYGADSSLALDPARQAIHTMTFTLPEGFSWNEVLKEYAQPLNLEGGYWRLGNTPILTATASADSGTFVQKVSAALVGGKLEITLWQTAKGQTLPAISQLFLSLAQGAVVVGENQNFEITYAISLQVNAQVIYTFDQPLSGDGNVSWTSVTPKTDLEYEKTVDSNSNSLGYSGSSYYELRVTNATIFHHSLKEISDPLPTDLFITPQGIRDLFTLSRDDLDNQRLAGNLTLTISNARQYHYEGDNALGYVTLSDGKTKNLLTAEMTDEYGTDYTDGVTVTITLGTIPGTLRVVFDEGRSEEVPMDKLDHHLKVRGLALLWDTQYTVTWNFGDDYKIPSGDAFLIRIPVEPKSSFQHLKTDWVTFRGASTSDVPSEYDSKYDYITNIAFFEDTVKHEDSVIERYRRDYAIGKSVNASTIQNGGILNYSILVYRSAGSPQEVGVPVVDAVSGTQCLLAPVSENQGQSWATNAEIHLASDGTQYYLLKLPESARESGRYIYKGVWLNGYYADSVTVTALDELKAEQKAKYDHTGEYTDLGNALAEDGYLTEIRWYLASPGYYVRELEYSVLADVAYSSQENTLSGTVCNIAYLNDRDNHRLFSPTGTIPIHTVGGDKELLGDDGQVLEGKTSTVSAGETVHYRLTINNWIPKGVTIKSTDLWDTLPSTYGVFAWTPENVELSYALASGKDSEVFSWKITVDEKGSYSIQWPDGVKIPASDTLYIYVDLTFPADTSGNSLWKAYCENVQGNIIENSFRFINETYSVTHNLALPGSAYIQKGVQGSWYNYDSGNGNKDFRYYSEKAAHGATLTMRETFYILLYNDGPGLLYLTELQDHFPTDSLFTYSNGLGEPKLIKEKDYFSSLPQDMTLVQASIEMKETNDAFFFTFSQSDKEEGMPTISYDSDARAYYLKPHQAIAFSYVCRLNTDLAYWESAVAMPLYDPHNTGVGVAQISQIHNNLYMQGKIGNDGRCTYLTTEEGSDCGYTSSYADEGWVSSSVPLRKETVAGLEKKVLQKRSLTGEVSAYAGYAGPSDSLLWELTVYNDSSNIIDGFTITDTLPDRYTLDVGTVKISGLWENPDTPFNLFSVQEVVTEGDKVKEIHLADGDIVQVDGEVHDGYGYSLKLYYNEDNQLVLELSVDLGERYQRSQSGIIWPGKNLKVSFWTKNYTNIRSSTSYVNSAVLTTRQELNYDKVSHGRVQYDDAGKPIGILARAVALITSGYSTGSEKTVTEVGTPGNTASSNQVGSITLTKTDNAYSNFTYELQVDNQTESGVIERGMDWITLIDNLPQLDDTMPLNQKVQRGSEFQVEFAENPQVKVWYVTENGTEEIITDKAVIQYSDKVIFGSGDWGKVGSIPESDGWGASSAGARSIRIYIPSDGEKPAVPAGATLHVSFECQVKMDENVVPGCTAWNSFGYRYQMVGDIYTLEAAPLEVGIRIPDYPRIQKVLTDETGEAVIAEKDTEFYFLVYKGEKISGDFATGAELLRALADAQKDFTIATVTVLKGASQAELKLENLKICTYTPEKGWEETANPWVWENGESYTVVELGDKLTAGLGSYQDYEFASLDYVSDNSYTFQYNKSTSQLIRGENTLALRKLQIQKVDQVDQSHKLPGAVFGLYSPNPGDQLTGDALQTAATALELTDEQIQELNQKTVITVNETFYYLYRLGKTDDKGLIAWENLPGMSYCYVELWAPEGYYITQKEPVVVSFQEGDAYLRSVTHTVTNKQIVYLPKTGGMGRWQIPALGLLLCAAVVTVFLGKRRKKAA